MKQGGWSPLTGKWLRRGVGLIFIACGSLALVLTPASVGVFANGTFLPFQPLPLLVIVAGAILALVP